jgi:hypothetical protein
MTGKEGRGGGHHSYIERHSGTLAMCSVVDGPNRSRGRLSRTRRDRQVSETEPLDKDLACGRGIYSKAGAIPAVWARQQDVAGERRTWMAPDAAICLKCCMAI